ncbi:hypothetical protein J5500_03070 [Candidatus Saccharibacteria bacterium]|nr:hypothetical protein [Candidatus Saccharibacteria bacterium]
MAKQPKELHGKYIGLVERLDEHMAGTDVRIIPKYGNTKKELRDWAKEEYPDAQFVILDNTPALNEFFFLASTWSMKIAR